MNQPNTIKGVSVLTINVIVVPNNNGRSGLCLIQNIIPIDAIQKSHNDLHPVLSRISKFANTEIKLYIANIQSK
jgi:hypothetical protein